MDVICVFFPSRVSSGVAAEADLQRLLLDRSNRQGGGERVAVAGWHQTYFHVSSTSTHSSVLGKTFSP